MEGALTGIFSAAVLVFGIGIWILVLIIRRLIEAFAKKVAKIFPDKWEPWWIGFWREWALPALPIVLGVSLAVFVPSYPFPALFAASEIGRAFLGLVCGVGASYFYRLFKSSLNKVLPKKFKEKAQKIEKQLEGPQDE